MSCTSDDDCSAPYSFCNKAAGVCVGVPVDDSPTRPATPVSNVIQLSTRTGDRCHIDCESNLALVCDQYGNKYQNACVFATEQCKNPNLKYDAKGCGASRPAHVLGPYFPPDLTPTANCALTFNCATLTQTGPPLCDTRGALYANECSYNEFKCLYPSVRTQPIPCAPWQLDEYAKFQNEAQIRGQKCMSGPCAKDARRFCGSDGVLYVGTCARDRAKCKNPQLTFKEGPC